MPQAETRYQTIGEFITEDLNNGRRLNKSLLNYIKSKLNDLNDSEDVLQNVYLNAIKGQGTFKGEFTKEKLRMWFFGIANNSSIDFLRKKYRIKGEGREINETELNLFCEKSLDCLDCLDCFPKENPSPINQLIKKEKREIIFRNIQNLTPRCREIIINHYFKRMSYKEIKKLKGTKLGTIKSGLYRSRESLSKIPEIQELNNDY
jgi:RNA polymerase sigma-70 factor (ECF subfamily)